MFLLLKPLKMFLPHEPVNTRSATSYLNVFAVKVLIFFSLLLASCQFLGTPMNCVTDQSSIPKSHIDDYCFVQTTFIALDMMDPNFVGQERTAHRGVGAGSTKPEDLKDNSFYQWVCYVLCFQGICFYVPQYLWSLYEGGKMKMLVMDLSSPVVAEDKKDERKKLLVNFFIQNLHWHRNYALDFYFSELLSLVNVVVQICFTDWFLGGQFITYGLAVLADNKENKENEENEKRWSRSTAMAHVCQL